MIVYRLEGKDGQGPYQGDPYSPVERLAMRGIDLADRVRNPTPLQDGVPAPRVGIASEYFFGFKSREALDAWFPEPILGLLESEYGMSVTCYKVEMEKVLFGDKQVAFRKRDAILI